MTHRRFGFAHRFAAAVACTAALAWAHQAPAATTVLALGDSITKGEGSFSTGGYRMFLDQKLKPTFHFIGTRRDGDAPGISDAMYHNGYGGYQASSLGNLDRSIEYKLQTDRVFAQIGQPDVVLLHVGANTITHAAPRTPGENYAGSHSDAADAQLYRLLNYLGEALPTTQFMVAQIVPKLRGHNGVGQAMADTWQYNFGGTDGKGGIPGVLSQISSSIASRVNLVNMFQIDLNAINRRELIGDHRVDPDGDGIVDWAFGENGADIDEFSFHDAFHATAFNHYLLGDGVHPTSLGYQLMADQWYAAMKAAGIVHNPTPTAAAAGLALTILALRRRRHAA